MTVATGERWPLGSHDSAVRGVLWPRAGVVVSADLGGRIRRWDVRRDPETLRARLHAATRVCLTSAERQAWLQEDDAEAERRARACRATARP